MFDYNDSKDAVEKILLSTTKITSKSKIPASDNEFTYENGIKVWVGALFVDIVDSSKLFDGANEDTARIIRSFCSEIISILKDDTNYHEIGIRGDCVYAVFNTETKDDLVEVFRHAYRINSFMSMLNILLKKYNYQPIRAGIGLGCDEELVIKAGKNGTGINDKIWIGKALVDAAHLSETANRNGVNEIAMSNVFYNNIIDILTAENSNYSHWIQPYSISYITKFYHCSIIESGYNKWIDNNL